jgi:hypothetical protein
MEGHEKHAVGLPVGGELVGALLFSIAADIL